MALCAGWERAREKAKRGDTNSPGLSVPVSPRSLALQPQPRRSMGNGEAAEPLRVPPKSFPASPYLPRGSDFCREPGVPSTFAVVSDSFSLPLLRQLSRQLGVLIRH